MLPLALVALALARPPVAYVDTGTKHVPLTISSWCWAAHCSAPIARARRVIQVHPGATLRIHLQFTPTAVSLNVGGAPAKWKLSGHDITWLPKHAGGLSLTATGVRGFVTYVGRVAFRP
ncbi:MAG TPA: hypothetical protein VGU02_16840 [Gaiellaceae bacterium]|nr:hypothetical protein [Gaiellaceae bacterium]